MMAHRQKHKLISKENRSLVVREVSSDYFVFFLNLFLKPLASIQRIDFKNDWKVITMFVGGNDICDFCTDSVSQKLFHNSFWRNKSVHVPWDCPTITPIRYPPTLMTPLTPHCRPPGLLLPGECGGSCPQGPGHPP